MQAELSRCIAATQKLLSDLDAFAIPVAPAALDAQASRLLSTIASSGIPRIDDSRVPNPLNTKLHALTEEHFRKACLTLRERHAHTDLPTLRRLALELQSTYTVLYERKLLEAANMRRKPSAIEKQPFANDVLVYAFAQSPTPTRRERERLASLTGMTIEQVRVWFQNRRSRTKKKAPELQSRPGIQLHELLERVVATSKAASAAKQSRASIDYEDDYDSGYQSEAVSHRSKPLRMPLSVSRRPVPLTTSITTPRSYPAEYLPQPLISHSHFESPSWRRSPATCPAVASSTVTVDELARSMARLTLRHRRHPSASNPTTSDSAIHPAPVSAPLKKTKKHGRKVAGGSRAACVASPALPVAHEPQATTAWSPDTAPALVTHSPLPPNKCGRKKAGPPRRKPANQALSRQASNSSITSTFTTSTDSSRSTSYSSDFSFTSFGSDISCTSIDSLSLAPQSSCAPSQSDRPPFDLSNLFATTQQPAQVPVYDLSSMPYCLPNAAISSPDFTALLDEPTMLQLLQNAENHSQPPHNLAPVSAQMPAHGLEVGVADMGDLVDLSSTGYPNLEALLADSGFHFTIPGVS